MAHDIATINGREAMAYLGETPWHRLGTPMTGAPTVEQALQAASLDWTVLEEKIFIRNAKGNVGPSIKNRKALVRDVDRKVLSIVGKDYPVLQNREAFEVLKPAVERFGCVIECAGALGQGDRVWMLAKMPQVLEPVAGDKIAQYFLISTGHTGYTPYIAKPTPVRVVCQNTLNAALADGRSFIKLHHTKTDMEAFDAVEAMITELVEGFATTGAQYRALAAKQLRGDDLRAYVHAVLGLKRDEELAGKAAFKRDSILELAATGVGSEFAPGTAWAAYNAVTELVDHVRAVGIKSPKVLRAADKSALFGPNALLKARALKLALVA